MEYYVSLTMPIEEVDSPEAAIREFRSFVEGSGWDFYAYSG